MFSPGWQSVRRPFAPLLEAPRVKVLILWERTFFGLTEQPEKRMVFRIGHCDSVSKWLARQSSRQLERYAAWNSAR